MGDLISRKALLKEFGIDEDTPDVVKILIAMKLKDIEKKINETPTAHDVDKVIYQLQENTHCDNERCYFIPEEAIRIVKAGGANE